MRSDAAAGAVDGSIPILSYPMAIPYLMAAMPVGIILRLILRNGISPWPRYLLRVIFLLQSGCWSSVFAQREKRLYGERISACVSPEDPVLIVGHWRSGSTYLHQMLSCDPALAAPTLFQVTYPGSFMSSRRYVEPVMKRFIGPTRPIDNVKAGLDEPMEEEDAIFRSTGLSPYERLVFPRSGEYFLLRDETFLPQQARQDEWEKAMRGFVAKLHLHTGRRVALKNPFHSMRIPTIARLFPRAVFIHITRDPLQVVPSTIRMWSRVAAQNCLRRGWRTPGIEDVAIVFNRLLTQVRTDLQSLAPDRSIEIRFEELEKNPTAIVRACYRKLGMEFTPAFDMRLSAFLKSVAGYRKNSFSLSPSEKAAIRSLVRQDFS